MLASFLIMFREGVEAALIVGIIAAYLKQTNRAKLLPAIWVGIGLATLLCLEVGLGLQWAHSEFPKKQQELFAAVIGGVAVFVLTWMVFWMKGAARSIKGELQAQIETAVESNGRWNSAIVAMAFFAVAREGLETVVFLLATLQQGLGFKAPLGALLGYGAAIAVGIGIYYGGVRIDLKRFFKWTGAFILLVAAGLLSSSVRAAHEAGVWNILQGVVYDATAILPRNGILGSILAGIFGYNDDPTVSEILVYLAYLLPTAVLFFRDSRSTAVLAQTVGEDRFTKPAMGKDSTLL